MWNYEIDDFIKKNPLQNIIYDGTFTRDFIPKIYNDTKKIDETHAYIVNNKKSTDENGEHWILIVKNTDGKIYNYDSFFRKTHTIGFKKSYIEAKTLNKIIQNIFQTNCGHRCLAFLYTIDYFNDIEIFNIL